MTSEDETLKINMAAHQRLAELNELSKQAQTQVSALNNLLMQIGRLSAKVEITTRTIHLTEFGHGIDNELYMIELQVYQKV